MKTSVGAMLLSLLFIGCSNEPPAAQDPRILNLLKGDSTAMTSDTSKVSTSYDRYALSTNYEKECNQKDPSICSLHNKKLTFVVENGEVTITGSYSIVYTIEHMSVDNGLVTIRAVRSEGTGYNWSTKNETGIIDIKMYIADGIVECNGKQFITKL